MRLRLSRTAWLILGGGIFVIVLGILLLGYGRLSGEHANVEGDLSAAQNLLPTVVSEREYWENQLAQLEDQLAEGTSSLNASKARFPRSVDSIEYDEELFIIAHAHDLEIASITASEPYQEDILGIIYTTTIFEVEVMAGEHSYVTWTQGHIDQVVDNIVGFLNALVTSDYFDTASIDLVSIIAPADEEGEEVTEPSAIITLVIYSYQEE
ncbi:MAG TPA: hypothetical protein G4N91_01820 [Dehalococcoidia bacterium]|nr:hypothetical protein [Dehalococcoidia bacterium]